MQALHPQFKAVISADKVMWEGALKPTPLSCAYRLKVGYQLGLPPRVSVLSPALRPRVEGESIPHMYNGKFLCLHYPPNKEWAPHDYVAATIIPWASLWLYYYEVWHATGEWLGGGVEHQGDAKSFE